MVILEQSNEIINEMEEQIKEFKKKNETLSRELSDVKVQKDL